MNLYVAAKGFEKELEKELGNFKKISDTFFLSQEGIKSLWAQDILFDVQEIELNSITDAVKKLKNLHTHWVGESVAYHRRCRLIQEQLNFYKPPKLDFLKPLPSQKFGCFVMVDKNKLYASTQRKHPLPFGIVAFKENKNIPPSRAYLKLWELFTVYQIVPKAGEYCLDLGSSPGGWSWVLSELGCNVVSVDKAPLDEKISKIKNIQYLKKDAFLLNPTEIPKMDWLFSDIICTPERLYQLILQWREAGIEQFVCTIKFKGETDFKAIEKFKALPNSRLFHLYHNKHELTFVLKKLEPFD